MDTEAVVSPEEMFRFTEDEMKFIGSEVASVLGGNPNRFFGTAKLVIAYQYTLIHRVCRPIDLFGHLTFHLRVRYRITTWQVK